MEEARSHSLFHGFVDASSTITAFEAVCSSFVVIHVRGLLETEAHEMYGLWKWWG
jgi:hypothetical protein